MLAIRGCMLTLSSTSIGSAIIIYTSKKPLLVAVVLAQMGKSLHGRVATREFVM